MILDKKVSIAALKKEVIHAAPFLHFLSFDHNSLIHRNINLQMIILQDITYDPHIIFDCITADI